MFEISSIPAVQPVKNDVIHEANVNADQLPLVFPGSLTVTGTTTAGNGEVDTQVFGLGWPNALAALTHNPFASTPTLVRQLVAGTTFLLYKTAEMLYKPNNHAYIVLYR